MPRIIDPDLFSRIFNNDPKLTELNFGISGTNFFGSAPTIELNLDINQNNDKSRTHGPGVYQRFAGQYSPPKRSFVNKQLAHTFFYSGHPFAFLYREGPPIVVTKRTQLVMAEIRQVEERKGCGFEELAEALKHNTIIESINFTSDDPCTMMQDEKDARVMLGAIKHNPALKDLTLGKTAVGEESFSLLCEMLRKNFPPLRYLAINSADIVQDKGRLKRLLDMVRINNTLEMAEIAYPSLEPYNYVEKNDQWQTSSSSSMKKSGNRSDEGIQALINQIHETVRRRAEARRQAPKPENTELAELKRQIAEQDKLIKSLIEAQNQNAPPFPNGASAGSRL